MTLAECNHKNGKAGKREEIDKAPPTPFTITAAAITTNPQPPPSATSTVIAHALVSSTERVRRWPRGCPSDNELVRPASKAPSASPQVDGSGDGSRSKVVSSKSSLKANDSLRSSSAW